MDTDSAQTDGGGGEGECGKEQVEIRRYEDVNKIW
jgi:hypothetical protein